VLATDEPCIVKTKQMMEGIDGVVSLAQGVVHWLPPQRALETAKEAAATAAVHAYGPASGYPALRQALVDKVAMENGLQNVCATILPCHS
jgi:aromatic aminotransferase